DLRIEALAMRLRTSEGAPTTLLASLDPIESLVEQGWITVSNDRIALTRSGKALADPIAGLLV
ncbi:MAG TPA: hypothetical protein PLA50_20460, partial [Bacteroidia bacterium]|nr:hypothetical protein [Bacteroidia bacterium]